MAWTPTLAVAGLDYYNHTTFPSLQHSLLMTTLKDSRLYQLQLNTAGDSIISTSSIGSLNFGRLRDLCISPDGNIYISTSNSNAGGGTKVDKIIELYDPSLSVTTTENTGGVQVYPNPTGDEITIVLPFSLPITRMFCTITDIAGKTVLNTTVSGAKSVLSLGALPAGIYMLTINEGSRIVHKGKIMKQ